MKKERMTRLERIEFDNQNFFPELADEEAAMVAGGYSESCNNGYCYREYQSPGDFYQYPRSEGYYPDRGFDRPDGYWQDYDYSQN